MPRYAVNRLRVGDKGTSTVILSKGATDAQAREVGLTIEQRGSRVSCFVFMGLVTSDREDLEARSGGGIPESCLAVDLSRFTL